MNSFIHSYESWKNLFLFFSPIKAETIEIKEGKKFQKTKNAALLDMTRPINSHARQYNYKFFVKKMLHNTGFNSEQNEDFLNFLTTISRSLGVIRRHSFIT